MKGFVIILILFFSLGLVLQTNSRREMADLVLLNGTVWTVNPDQPWAAAVALKGDLVLPGFIDSHAHFLDGGFSLLSIRLRDAESREKFITRIDDKAKEIENGVGILDGNWDHQSFDPPELPRKNS